MNIRLNGQEVDFPHEIADVASLLQAIGLAERRIAVEVNGTIVSRSRHSQHSLHAGDRVEIIQAIGGG